MDRQNCTAATFVVSVPVAHLPLRHRPDSCSWAGGTPCIPLAAMPGSGSTRGRLGKAASSAAATVESIATDRRSYAGTVKDASHAAFYAGLAKGFTSAMNGFVLFLSKKELRQRLKDSMALIANAQIGYAVLAAAFYFFLRDPADNLGELLWSLSRWARIVTMIVTLFLERKAKATEAMFYDSLRAADPNFAASVESAERVRAGTREKLRKFKRVGKMAALRGTGYLVTTLLPGGELLAVPTLKYVSVRATLGAPVSAVVAALHALPNSWLASSHLDDMLLQFTEAVMDAEDLGGDVVYP